MMDKNEKIATGAALLMIGAGVVSILTTARTEQKKRDQIEANKRRQMEAIKYAQDKVVDRIWQRGYKNLDDALNDFNFEMIVYRIEE